MNPQIFVKLLLFIVFTLSMSFSRGSSGLSCEEILKSLQSGNQRFVAGNANHPNQDATRRANLLKGQEPIVTVLSCSDSRVPVEILFDQGLGDIFVVRVAGNVADTDEIGSIEYAVGHLNTPLLVVMGHTQCGAVKAVLSGAQAHGSLPLLLNNINPAITEAKAKNPNASAEILLNDAVTANVWISIDDIFKRSSEVRDLVRSGKLKVVGAIYDLATGEVRWLGEPSDIDGLLTYTSKEQLE